MTSVRPSRAVSIRQRQQGQEHVVVNRREDNPIAGSQKNAVTMSISWTLLGPIGSDSTVSSVNEAFLALTISS